MNIPTLECEKKLIYAKRHLKEMRKAYPEDRETLDYELSALLLESRSVVDCMNEDINLQFNLKLSMEKDIVMQLKELKSKDVRVAEYLKWHMNYHTELLNQFPIYHYFFNHDTGLRNISDHRKTVSPNKADIKIFETLVFSDSLKIEVHNLDTGKTEIFEDIKTPNTVNEERPKETATKTDWSFDDGKQVDMNMIDACSQVVNILQTFVTDFKTKFIENGSQENPEL